MAANKSLRTTNTPGGVATTDVAVVEGVCDGAQTPPRCGPLRLGDDGKRQDRVRAWCGVPKPAWTRERMNLRRTARRFSDSRHFLPCWWVEMACPHNQVGWEGAAPAGAVGVEGQGRLAMVRAKMVQ